MSVGIKICGITTKSAAKALNKNKVEYAGFVFYPSSPRNVSIEKAADLVSILDKNIKKVAVLVNPSNEDIENILDKIKIDYLQLHGDETVDRIYDIHKKFALPVIKAIKVQNSDDIAYGRSFEDIADMLLFDAKVPSATLPGGNGLSFDWTLLKFRQFTRNWFLSGGLNIANIDDALNITNAKLVDVSSCLESEPGKKDVGLINNFVKKVRKYEVRK